MQKRSSILILLIAALCFTLAGWMHTPLLKERRVRQLNQADPLENTTPLVAFTTVALGGFRGIIADMLWIRASRLQTEGKYFELVQLSDWITKLEPRFAAVWSYHAWNMSYNVSVMFSDPADRWRWVRHGISLLRDEGLYYNPGHPELYKELGWHFQHKVGDHFDSAHSYYQQAWREEMERLLPGGRLDFDVLSAQPADEVALRKDPDTDALVRALQDLGEDPFSAQILDRTQGSSAAAELLNTHPGAGSLLAYVRARTLEEDYRLLPKRMQQIETQFGAMDWRLPQPHAVYWATSGLEYAVDFDSVALHRMVFQSLANLYLDTGPSSTVAGVELRAPNMQTFPIAMRGFELCLAAHPEEGTFHEAFRNFVRRGMFESFLAGELEDAEGFIALLHEQYPEQFPRPEMEAALFDMTVFQVGQQDITFEEVAFHVLQLLAKSQAWLDAGDPIRSRQTRALVDILQSQAVERNIIPENAVLLDTVRDRLQGGVMIPYRHPEDMPPEQLPPLDR